MTRANPICVAVDTPDLSKALALVTALKGSVGYVKLGMEFFYAQGAAGYSAVAKAGIPVFLDLKLHDIPNTVEQGLRSLMTLAPAPAIINVHATGGLDMLMAARKAVPATTKLIAVTILTSLSNENIWAAGFDPARDTAAQALNLARLTRQAGLDGIVCSPLDLDGVRKALGRDFLTVVPGIRPADSASHDQKRIATPASAIAAGADILVIGRAITGAAGPADAARAILASLP
jgi:orotidine-5'-phosphate decarboxylase